MSDMPKEIWANLHASTDHGGYWQDRQWRDTPTRYIRADTLRDEAKALANADVETMYAEEWDEWVAKVKAFLEKLSQ